jgi:hypothetical protein
MWAIDRGSNADRCAGDRLIFPTKLLGRTRTLTCLGAASDAGISFRLTVERLAAAPVLGERER